MIGAIIGDIVGSRFERANCKSTKFELVVTNSGDYAGKLDALLYCFSHICYRTYSHGRPISEAVIGLWGSLMEPQIEHLTVSAVWVPPTDFLHTLHGIFSQSAPIIVAFKQRFCNRKRHHGVISK